MTSAAWTDEALAQKRAVGDPAADAVIRQIYERQAVGALDAFMRRLVSNREIPADLPPELQDYLRATEALPPWADLAKIREAERLFNVCGPVSLVSLVCASLPECYTMHIGVRILALTGQLGHHANRRLHQTASMVLAVMAPRGLEPNGTGIRQAQKVRLIHAAVRYRILGAIGRGGVPASAGEDVPEGAVRSVADVMARHAFDWTIARDGCPLNQEDLAYTLLTFGYVIPRGMRDLGIQLTDAQCDAFVHAWNVTGTFIGVDESLMAHTYAEAAELFARIKARQGGPSPAGTQLTASLLAVVERDLLRQRVLRPLGPILVRVLVGDDTARMLGLDVRHGALVTIVHRAAVGVLRPLSRAMALVNKRFHLLRWLSAWIGGRLIERLNEVTYHGERVPVAIPEGWG